MISKPGWIKPSYLRFDWLSIIVGIGVTALVLGRLTTTLADPDLWGYLSFGRLFWNSDDFPYSDIFSYMPTQTLWVYHEWLTGVIFYPIYQFLGAAGLQGLKYATALGTAVLIYKTARTRGASPQTAVFCLLLISPFFNFAYSPVRAQIFTNLFFVLTLYLLEKSKQGNRPHYLWWLVPIDLLWANLHGGFLAGLGMIGLYAVGSTLSRQKSLPYWLILVPTTLTTLVNPYGLQYWIYLKNALLMPRPDIDEWHSVLFALQNGEFSTNILIFIILFILACLMLLTSKKRLYSDVILILATSLFAIQHVRHQSLFFIIMGCCAPFYFTHAWALIRSSASQTARSKKTARLVILIIFLGLFFLFGMRFVTGRPFDLTLKNPSDARSVDYNYPVDAVEFIHKHQMTGNILTEFAWGEYILWSLPQCKVAMDGRYETVYTEKSAREYFAFTKGETGWRDYLGKYPHDMILFRRESVVSALIRMMPDHWSPAFSDADSILFIRKKTPP